MNDSSDIRQTTSSSPKKSISINGNQIIYFIVVIVVGILGYWLGTVQQKHHDKSSTSAVFTTNGSGRGGFSRFAGGGIGTVSSVSASSITVNPSSGSAKTYAITSSTTITDQGQTVSYTDISSGEKVIVIPSTSNSSDASRILVNPSFGGFSGGPSIVGSSTSGSTTAN